MELSQRDRLKQAAAREAVRLVEDGMIVGLGTGSTAAFAVAALGERVREGLRIVGIPTSEGTATQARALGIPLVSLAEHPRIDLTIDGADEVQLHSLNLIKGLGGALLREKIVAASSHHLVIIVDAEKLVEVLGQRTSVPVEVVPFGWQATAGRVQALGATTTLRTGTADEPFVTDGGHYILDCAFGPIADPPLLERQLACRIGVVDSGLFIGLTTKTFVASPDGILVLAPTT